MPEDLHGASIETRRKWLKFLLERVGHNNLPKLLDYYKSIGWISGSAAERLLEIAALEKRLKGTSWTLSPEEQRISRFFLEKLNGREIEDSLLKIPFPGKARPDIEKKIEIRHSGPANPIEKKKMEFNIHRREITINNLEKELEEKYVEIGEQKKKIMELENALLECHKELMRNKIYMDIMDQNLRLRKVARESKNLREIE